MVVADLSTKAEPWWVDYLSRHPVLIPYAVGIKRLDKIYLDTSFVGRTKTHQLFSPKVCSSSPRNRTKLIRLQHEGIRELLEKVGKYPQDTIFHFNTWTFGYEDVWVALAAAFDTKACRDYSPITECHSPLLLIEKRLYTDPCQ